MDHERYLREGNQQQTGRESDNEQSRLGQEVLTTQLDPKQEGDQQQQYPPNTQKNRIKGIQLWRSLLWALLGPRVAQIGREIVPFCGEGGKNGLIPTRRDGKHQRTEWRGAPGQQHGYLSGK